MISRALVIAMVAACSPHEPQPTRPEPVTSVPDPSTHAEPDDPAPCEAVAAAIIKTGGDLFIKADAAKEVIMRHCKEDLWSVDARRCIVATMGDTRAACDAKLSETQHREFETDMKAHGITVSHPPPSP